MLSHYINMLNKNFNLKYIIWPGTMYMDVQKQLSLESIQGIVKNDNTNISSYEMSTQT